MVSPPSDGKVLHSIEHYLLCTHGFLNVLVSPVLLVWHWAKAPVCPLESELSMKESTFVTSRLLSKLTLHTQVVIV